MLELGAFWSYYSLWLLHRFPAAKTILLEPDPAYLEVGRRNFSLNGRNGLFFQGSAGAEEAAPASFVCESDATSRDLPTESVASLMRKGDVDHLDILLADIQGAELEVLQGAADLFRRRLIRFIVISTHHHSISNDPRTHERCLKIVRDTGGHVIVQ